MTYCPPHDPVQVFTFSALVGSDILGPNDTELGCGDGFTMPFSASVCITVTDNDTSLSGDARRNERGDDRSWQTADIEVSGALVEDGAKIYAEEYYGLRDADGNCYRLVEIEVAGACATDRQDYYAFVGDVPPPGATLTVTGRGNVCRDWIDYRDLSAGLKWEPDPAGIICVEAEDLALRGYRIDDVDAASGGEVIRLRKDSGEASVVFGAEGGTYDLDLTYIDECDGQGAIEVWVNGTLVHEIALDQDDNGNGGNRSSLSTARIPGLELEQGDEIVLRGVRDAWEFARIDKLSFQSNQPPVALDDTGATDEDTPVTLALLTNDTDPDGDLLSVTLAGGAAPGESLSVQSAGGRMASVTVNAAGLLVLDPGDAFNAMAADDTDTVTIGYTISDGRGGTDTATATITIDGLNDPPVATDDFLEVGETETGTIALLANDFDPEGDALSVTLLSQPLEGTITLGAGGVVTFDPGTDFLGLIDGQTATVTFDYQISDGEFTDTATATVRVLGEGTHAPDCVSEAQTTQLADGTGILVELKADDTTADGTADYRFRVGLDTLTPEQVNVIFLVDVSGSTGEPDSFGTGTTVLDAERAALSTLTQHYLDAGIPEDALTITVLPFDSRAAPTDTVGGTDALPITTIGDDETMDPGAIDAALDALNAGGETNYLAAILAAQGTLQGLGALDGGDLNMVYFLSDGDPFPLTPSQQPAILSLIATTLHAHADVHAVALGPDVTLDFVNAVDNTGGAERVSDLDALDTALSRSPVAPETVLGATLNVFGSDGTLADSFAFTAGDFTETATGLELAVEDLPGLDPLLSDTNRAELVVDLDLDGDTVGDQVVTLSVDIDGVLPESVDLV